MTGRTDPAVAPDRAPGPAGTGPPDRRGRLTGRGWPARSAAAARNTWRQLTSMRTALVLLFLLALAAVPGSLLPQRTVNREDVAGFYERHPELAPVLDRLGGFDVYGSPWFSAIYLLLFTSLVGCVVPRLRDHLRSLRRPPVPAPRRMSRLPAHRDGLLGHGAPAELAETLHARLRARRWRSLVRRHDDGTATVSAEKGYLKETGNLLMHAAMVAVLVGVALGGVYGWHGNRLVVAGEENGFCNTRAQYDETGGSDRALDSLPPFCLTLTGFDVSWTERGQPLSYLAHAELTEGGGAPRQVEFTVNDPLRLDGAAVYLLGEGYAPVLRYTDRFGRSQTVTAPFLPVDDLGTAEGVAMFPDANRAPARAGATDRSDEAGRAGQAHDPDGADGADGADGTDGTGQPDDGTGRPDDTGPGPPRQVAFQGLYLPTAPAEGPMAGSVHPAERNPRLMLLPYRGDLGVNDGSPQSVWTLDRQQLASGALEQVGEPEFLSPGERMSLDDGTTVEFVGTERWITVTVRHDPGQPVVLAGAGLLLLGLVLSLTGRRRRVWFRLTPAPDAPTDSTTTYRSKVTAGGLPRSDHPGFADEFAGLVAGLPLTDPALEPDHAGRNT